MSASNVKKFFSKVNKDEKLQAQLKKKMSGIRDIAKEHGFEFSNQEMYAHWEKKAGVKKPKRYADPDTCCLL
jgi:predicted ribosomally synthesized peptide with nif11-like leader